MLKFSILVTVKPNFTFMKLKITQFKLLLILFFLLGITAQSQTVRYVKEIASGTGDGSSWSNASADLQAMINLLEPGDQVWVAEGTYLPQRSPDNLEVITLNNRDNAFTIRGGVEVFGGFSSTGSPTWEDRDWETYSTVLSGNLGTSGTIGDNAYHVVVMVGTDEDILPYKSKLDGFVITGGNADDPDLQSVIGLNDGYPVYRGGGGGVYNAFGYSYISNCRITDNQAFDGGGVRNSQFGNVRIDNVLIDNNIATNGGGMFSEFDSTLDFSEVTLDANEAQYGGGLYNANWNATSFTDVVISNNSAVDGGGIYNYGSSGEIHNTVIIHNTSSSNGGGIYNRYNSTFDPFDEIPRFKNVLVAGNSAINGGGMYNEIAAFRMEDVQIFENTASENGGAVYNDVTGIVMRRVSIRGNTALNGGGIYKSGSNSDTLITVLLAGNSASNNGGAVYAGNSNSSFDFMNVTIAGNSASSGGGVYNTSSTLELTNTVIYGNSSGIINTSTEPVYHHSLVEGLANTSNGNVDGAIDPKYLDPLPFGEAPTTEGNYSVRLDSPLVNHGDTNLYNTIEIEDSNPDLDLDGNDRIYNMDMGIRIDIGAFEHTITPDEDGILYVREGATGNGSSWEDASGDLQAMIDALDVQQIWMGAGTYKPIRSLVDRSVIEQDNRENSFYVNKEVKIYGGFPTGSPGFDNRDWHSNVTILSGDIGVEGDVSDNSYNVVVMQGYWFDLTLSPETVLDGVTVTGGNANGPFFGAEDILRVHGGGIYNEYADVTLNNITVQGNMSTYGGGGVFNLDSSPVIKNCIIRGNSAELDGGGGMYNNGCSDVRLINVQVTGNVRGGINSFSSDVTLTNVTISGNTSVGVSGAYPSTYIVRNSVLSGNEFLDESVSNAVHSLASGATTADENGNIDGALDPLFVNAPSWTTAPFTGGDYSLQSNSPLINAGSNSLYQMTGYSPATDTELSGNYRIYNYANGGVIDMGAYEQNVCFTSLPETTALVFCGDYTIADLTAAGSGLQWYEEENGGEPLAEGVSIETGTYYVSQSVEGCESPRVAVPVAVTVTPPPTGPATQVVGNDLPLNATVADLAAEGIDIQWYASPEAIQNNGPLALDTVLTANTQYFATQTIEDCQSAPLIVTVTSVMGITDLDTIGFTYYPNPTGKNLYIKADTAIDMVTVYTLTGQKVFEKQWHTSEGIINLESLTEGSYIVKVVSNEISKSFLVIKSGE